MPKSINLIGMYVRDVFASVEFYAKLGFQTVRVDKSVAELSLGAMTLHCIDKETAREQSEAFQKEAFGEPKGTGLYINIEVEDVDTYYRELKDKGLKPSSEPRNWPWGHREFAIRDSDGYKLVFYQKTA